MVILPGWCLCSKNERNSVDFLLQITVYTERKTDCFQFSKIAFNLLSVCGTTLMRRQENNFWESFLCFLCLDPGSVLRFLELVTYRIILQALDCMWCVCVCLCLISMSLSSLSPPFPYQMTLLYFSPCYCSSTLYSGNYPFLLSSSIYTYIRRFGVRNHTVVKFLK